MNDITGVMLNVSRLITSGSDAARQEVRRIAAEREARVATDDPAAADHLLAAVAQATKPTPVRACG